MQWTIRMTMNYRFISKCHTFFGMSTLFKRRQLTNEKLVMRPSFKGYSFHTYPAREFERKSSEYLQQRGDTYRLVQNINTTSPDVSQQCLTDIVRRVETTLKELLCCKLITALSNSKHELLARCREDLFLTWNGSMGQLRSLFDTPIRISPSMGTTVHFLDVELSQVNGVLHTKLHRDPVTNESELRDRFAYQTGNLSRLFQAAFIDAVCCNSAEMDFLQEVRYMTHTDVSAGFSTASIKQCSQQFHRQLDVVEMRDGVRVVPYDKLRQRILEHHQQQQVLKKQRHTVRENNRRLPCSKSGSTDRPVTMNDYLVDTKPSRQLLILPESERNKKDAS